jgi:two-component system, LytTR family, sensor kinase
MPRALWKRLFLYFLSWTVVASFFSMQAYLAYKSSNGVVHVGALLRFAFSEWYVWALLAPVVIWIARKLPISGDHWKRNLGAHVGASFAITVAHWKLNNLSLHYLLKRPASLALVYVFHSNLITYWILVGAAFGYDYYVRFRRGEVRAAQLSEQLAQTQLQALRAQFHPHFLFNTLNAISTLLHRDPEAADRMIARLSELLRITLEEVGVQRVPLAKELEFLERYLEIEQTRFADRLTVEFRIAPETLSAYMPYLILQPIVENSIRHGIAPRARVGVIEVRASRERDLLMLEVRDNGVGISRDSQTMPRKGTGLSNIKKRLENLYGENCRFEVKNGSAGGVQVTLAIPFEVGEGENRSV